MGAMLWWKILWKGEFLSLEWNSESMLKMASRWKKKVWHQQESDWCKAGWWSETGSWFLRWRDDSEMSDWWSLDRSIILASAVQHTGLFLSTLLIIQIYAPTTAAWHQLQLYRSLCVKNVYIIRNTDVILYNKLCIVSMKSVVFRIRDPYSCPDHPR